MIIEFLVRTDKKISKLKVLVLLDWEIYGLIIGEDIIKIAKHPVGIRKNANRMFCSQPAR